MGYILDQIVAFAHLLREMGVQVGPGQTVELARALEFAPITDRADFRAAARCVLVQRREDLPLFDTAFDFFWRAEGADPLQLAIPAVQAPRRRSLRLPRRADERAEPPETPHETQEVQVGVTLAYAREEALRTKDFGSFSWEEVQACKELLRRLRWRLSERRTRRRRPDRRGRALDMRRTLRDSMRHGGASLELRWRTPRTRRRPLVVLCDISGSMDRYSRILLQFVHTVSSGLRDVEAFVFGTRLTRITRLLRDRDIDEAVAEVSRQVLDWSGGTRIGETLKEFNFVWGRRVLGRGAVVLLISDGWDRGDADLLGREISRLQRSCHRLIWLNPLLGSPAYQPLTKGMRAALPFVDDFLPVHNLASLEQLGERLASMPGARPQRRRGAAGG
jgi:uncharacterized protein with von Willebrand factor type A (vWA) domain